MNSEAPERQGEHGAVPESRGNRELDPLLVLLHPLAIAATAGERTDATGALAGAAGIEDRHGELEQPAMRGPVRGEEDLEAQRLEALRLWQVRVGEAPAEAAGDLVEPRPAHREVAKERDRGRVRAARAVQPE